MYGQLVCTRGLECDIDSLCPSSSPSRRGSSICANKNSLNFDDGAKHATCYTGTAVCGCLKERSIS